MQLWFNRNQYTIHAGTVDPCADGLEWRALGVNGAASSASPTLLEAGTLYFCSYTPGMVEYADGTALPTLWPEDGSAPVVETVGSRNRDLTKDFVGRWNGNGQAYDGWDLLVDAFQSNADGNQWWSCYYKYFAQGEGYTPSMDAGMQFITTNRVGWAFSSGLPLPPPPWFALAPDWLGLTRGEDVIGVSSLLCFLIAFGALTYLAVAESPNAWGRIAAIVGQDIPDPWAKAIHAVAGLPLLFWTFAAPTILFVSSSGDATLTKPIVADILRVAVFVTALLSPIVVCLTAVGFAVGRRRRLPTFPRNRLRLRSRINLIPLVFVLLGVVFLLFCAMPTIGLGLLFGAEPHIFTWSISWFGLLWLLMIATAASLRKIDCGARTMGRVSCTKLVRAGLVVWWILVYVVLVSVMWRTGGPWCDDDGTVVWMSGGSQGILLASRYFVLFFACDPLSYIARIAQGISGIARHRREAREAEALRAAREPTESERDAQDRKSRHERLMMLWRGVAKAAPKLICAQQRAAERAFAPDGDGYRNALEHFQRLARGERLAAIYHSMGSPVRVAQALWLNRTEASLLSLRFSATAGDRSERSEKPENLV